jgi:hypothetical protein
MDHSIPHSPNGNPGHETTEVSPRLIIVSLGVLAVATLLVLLLVVGIFRFLKTTSITAPTTTAVQQQPLPPEPRIEIDAAQQFKGIKAREEHILSSYAWVDQNQGTVRIPIDRAIDLLSQRGLPSHDYLQDILAGGKAAKQQGK